MFFWANAMEPIVEFSLEFIHNYEKISNESVKSKKKEKIVIMVIREEGSFRYK